MSDNTHNLASLAPVHLTLETTSTCNLRCIMCKHHRPGIGHKNHVMNMDLFQSVLEELSNSIGFVCLTVTGDTFCDPLLSSRLASIKRHPKLTIEIITNGHLLTEQNLRPFQGMRNPLYITVSVDSPYDLTYSSIRGGRGVSVPLENLKKLKKLAQTLEIEEINQGISFVMMKRTILGLIPFLSIAAELGCDKFSTSHLIVVDETLGAESLFQYPVFTNYTIAAAREKALELGLQFHAPPFFAVTEQEILSYKSCRITRCDYLERRLTVGADGRVEACCNFLDPIPILGNSLKEPVMSVWNGERRSLYRQALREDNPLFPCNNCCILELDKEYLFASEPFGVSCPPELRNTEQTPDLKKEGFFLLSAEDAEEEIASKLASL
ncbi:MAG: radical SAM protein [Desulfomonile tiedjei]|uniref:Radical SAM protein n=1 Tax=Desulfomonile tiedjei TaxID=2358 RepID=A0A9D6V1C1_9BACT|nr:radical SAM protein [Desulfomonile tiedjei]